MPHSYNVRDFGARGDGATDDRVAIQSALDVASEMGGSVYMPRGVYRADNLILRQGVSLHGDGMEETVVRSREAGDGQGVLTIDAGVTQRVRLMDLGIDAGSDAVRHGIYIHARRGPGQSASGLWHSSLLRVRVSNFSGAQVWLRGGGLDSLDPIQFLDFTNIVVDRRNDNPASTGVLMSGQVNQTTWINGRVDAFGAGSAQAPGVNLKICAELAEYGHSTRDGDNYLSAKSGHTHIFIATSFQQAELAVLLHQVQNIRFLSCHFEGLSNGILATRASVGVVFDSPHLANSALASKTAFSIRAEQASSVQISNPIQIGSVGRLADTDGGTLSSVVIDRPGTVQPALTRNSTLQIAAADTINIGRATSIVVSGSPTPIKNVVSASFAGESTVFRAAGGPVAFAAGGNIGFGSTASPITLQPDDCLTLYKFDKGLAWGIR